MNTDDKITQRMRFAWWIPKATDRLSEYAILIAFPTATTVTRTLRDFAVQCNLRTLSHVLEKFLNFKSC
jgi:hypothetical protein